MWRTLSTASRQLDWLLILPLLAIAVIGLLTMKSFTIFADSDYFFVRQYIWLSISFLLMLGLSLVDFHFLRRGGLLLIIYLLLIGLLGGLLLFGQYVRGARGWIDLGSFSFQPFEFMKLALILILAKYFSRRHIAIAHYRHVLVSGLYALVPACLILLQPDFGGALIISAIWLGMIMVSGVSKKHLLIVILAGILAFGFFWSSIFTPSQKSRIISFIHPLEDIQGAGYSAFQSTIAVGSGELWGKGVGFGTQSRLHFLPEYETDFIFAAFAEEWGFAGALIFFTLFGLVVWRVVQASLRGAGNFETLFGAGLAIFLVAQFTVNVGMNIGLLPVTGLPLPFLSYGGSHLLVEFVGLGILLGMRRYSYVSHPDDMKNEFLGGV